MNPPPEITKEVHRGTPLNQEDSNEENTNKNNEAQTDSSSTPNLQQVTTATSSISMNNSSTPVNPYMSTSTLSQLNYNHSITPSPHSCSNIRHFQNHPLQDKPISRTGQTKLTPPNGLPNTNQTTKDLHQNLCHSHENSTLEKASRTSKKYQLVYTTTPKEHTTKNTNLYSLCERLPFCFAENTLTNEQILNIWGHNMESINMTEVFRILLQNPNGINPNSNNPNFQRSWQECQDKGVSLVGLSETNINWRKQLNYEHL